MGSRAAGGDRSWESRDVSADADITISDSEDEAEARMAASFSAEAEEVWHPLQYSCLENPMDGGAWWAAVHGVAKSRTQLSDLTLTFHFHALEKEMATHSSILA